MRADFGFFFNDTATTEIYTLSLHDALPISRGSSRSIRYRGFRRRTGRRRGSGRSARGRSEEHTSELQSPCNLVCRLLLEKKKRRIWHLPCTPARIGTPVIYQGYIYTVFFNGAAASEIYTLSLHDALPTSQAGQRPQCAR